MLGVALIAQVQNNVSGSFISPSGYVLLRYIIFAALTAVCTLSMVKKQYLPLIPTTMSFLTLPVMEAWTGRAFPAVFTTALLILLFSGVWIIIKIRRELQADISGLSVKEAMDSLDTAILFYYKNGHILLMNWKMQELMIKTAGRVVWSGRLYLEIIRPPDFTLHSPNFLCKTEDGEWLFFIREIIIGGRLVTQLTATDITEQNRGNLILREKQIELESQQDKLKSFIEDLEEYSRTEELLRIKTEIHDEQNEKLAVLLQYLRYEKMPDGESLAALRTGILRGAKKIETASSQPESLLEAITAQYESIGVKIIITGKLPFERDISAALVQILREATANSVIHGIADEVYVEITMDVNSVSMRVTDNSNLPTKVIREGNGIAAMRSRADKLGGTLTAEAVEGFMLFVMIPRKEGEING
jgi:signal transduction histidine kinase